MSEYRHAPEYSFVPALLAELEANTETTWAAHAFAELGDLSQRDIVFDVDGCLYAGEIYDGRELEEGETLTGTLRPGAVELLTLLWSKNNRLHLWSRMGAQHAGYVAQAFGLSEAGLIQSMHSKPLVGNYAITAEKAQEALGFMPTATVDNDPEDQVVDGGIRFVQTPTFERAANQRKSLTTSVA